ncbi:MAG: DUF4276 family protein [Candidatus Rokubacteria bacterium]|nr:DUF4276 family protein [Candidatus Rokubacteria bacterium]
MTFGGVVEGDKDKAVCEELIPRICPETEQVLVRVAGDRPQLMKKFPAWLKTLQHVTTTGGPVDKAFVVRDADNKASNGIESDMLQRIADRAYPFPRGVSVHAIRQEIDTWLLADINAINTVAAEVGHRPTKRSIPRPLEGIQQPSLLLQQVLSSVGLNYTAAICRKIARHIDLGILRAECPSFLEFEQKIIDP